MVRPTLSPEACPVRPRWIGPPPTDTVDGDRHQLAPGVWIVRDRRWLPPAALDTAAGIPDPIDEDAPEPRPVLRALRPAWQRRAICSSMPERLYDAIFFGEEELLEPGMRIVAVNAARRICAACPVARQCLTQALTEDDRYGVWGGASGRQRTRMRKAIAAGATVDEVVTAWFVRR